MFHADLHVHSKFSRATSGDADLEHLSLWARRKGLAVVATGDFTHPAWLAELRDKLVPAEPGLFRLRPDLAQAVERESPVAGAQATRFLLEVEISTIYKKGDRTRKVHQVVYAPGFEQAESLIQQLARIGNLNSDGRPILGLDSRDLLEITLAVGDGCFLIPAHIWTPWFAVLGSKSGFDSIDDCYGDLAPQIFALETGLSSDPPMNWRLSQLDRFTLVSNSDAHSPPKLGREACVFATELDYFAMRQALETGVGYAGTVEFFPEEGKYHLDGHRKCGVCLTPPETRQVHGLCPVCGQELTVGVMNRVEELADRPEGFRPPRAAGYRSLIPLAEVISEIRGVGEKSRQVEQAYGDVIRRVGAELAILQDVPVEELRAAGFPQLAEAIRRMRAGRVQRQAGYDGEYGVIRLFEPHELTRGKHVGLLFEMPPEEQPAADIAGLRLEQPQGVPAALEAAEAPADWAAGTAAVPALPAPSVGTGTRFLAELDPDQRAAAELVRGPLRIVAGPGTGKTRTLTYRIAHLIADHGVPAERCLAVTFSRRAAEEIRERLIGLLPDVGGRVPVLTFHALGLTILREQVARCELPDTFRVASEQERQNLLSELGGLTPRQAARRLAAISQSKRGGAPDAAVGDQDVSVAAYQQQLQTHGWVDFDDLILRPLALLRSAPELTHQYRQRWPWISVDEYQDIDDGQYELLRQLAAADGNLCVIGDPDQSIYGFRGANPQVLLRFATDFPAARTAQLTRNYRSSPTIVNAALQAIAPSTLLTDRVLESLADSGERIGIQTCPSERAEAEFVVHSIERLIGGATFFSLDSERVATHEGQQLGFGDFAVLYRTEAQAEALEEAFARSGIPFQQKSHRRLGDEPVIQELLEVMRQTVASGCNAAELTATELLKQAADVIRERYPQAAGFLKLLHPLSEACGRDAFRLLSEVELGAEVDLWDPRAARVSLLTCHAAKGLEFPVVFLVGCEDGILPLRWGDAEAEDVAEERRLFFVALTRARERLFLSHARQRRWRGQLRELPVSPFLKEIKDELLERAQRAGKRLVKPTADRQLPLF